MDLYICLKIVVILLCLVYLIEPFIVNKEKIEVSFLGKLLATVVACFNAILFIK